MTQLLLRQLIKSKTLWSNGERRCLVGFSLMFSLCLFNYSGLFEVFRGFYVAILTHVITRGLQGFIRDLQHLSWVESLWVNIGWTCDEKAKLQCPSWRSDGWFPQQTWTNTKTNSEIKLQTKLKRIRAVLKFESSEFPPCPHTLEAAREITIPSTIGWA